MYPPRLPLLSLLLVVLALGHVSATDVSASQTMDSGEVHVVDSVLLSSDLGVLGRAQGRDFEAEGVDERVQAAWTRSDVWLRSFRY